VNVDAFISFLPSTDLGRSADFYERVLGLELVLDQGTCRIYRVTESAYLGVCQREPFDEVQPVITTLVADDVEGWHTRIVRSGWAEVTEPEHSEVYGLVHIWVKDPDGNQLEIQRFDDPNWSVTP
jgi:catechol 2,3-dioxygenase-like lactoylglutathione lyase family enzyme